MTMSSVNAACSSSRMPQLYVSMPKAALTSGPLSPDDPDANSMRVSPTNGSKWCVSPGANFQSHVPPSRWNVVWNPMSKSCPPNPDDNTLRSSSLPNMNSDTC